MAFWVCQCETSRETTAQHFLTQAHYETYLPRIRIRQRVVALFPSYLFVRVTDHWWTADNSPAVIALLRSGDVPAKIDDRVVEKLKNSERGGLIRPSEKRGLRIGDRVRILNGSFAGHIGTLAALTAKQRQQILLDLLGRQVRVNLASGDTEAIPLDIAPPPNLR